jgi:DUF1680 family protein
VRIEVTPDKERLSFPLKIRIPGWATGTPVPSDLYAQTEPGSLKDVSVAVNGQSVPITLDRGYLTLGREWRAGDTVTLALAMPVRRIRCHQTATANHGRLAVERGPLVYCAEAADNGGRVLNLTLAPDAAFREGTVDVLGHRLVALTADARAVSATCAGGARRARPPPP